MRHLVNTKKLGRGTAHRMAMLRNLAGSLLEHGQISTTLGRAKALRPFVEKMVTIAKTKDRLTAIRTLHEKLFTDISVHNCFEYAEIFKDRKGGYLRILKNGFRYGDNAPVAIIQFVEKIQSQQNVQ